MALELCPFYVRFTHDRISNTFRNGTNIDDAIRRILRQEMDPHQFPPIEVVRFGGHVYSLSNRRLFMYRVLAQQGCIESIRAIEHDYLHAM
jgi:hypothetical protein